VIAKRPMFTFKPIVINADIGPAKFLADLVPKDPRPDAPSLPFIRKQPRTWKGVVVLSFVGPMIFFLIFLPLLGLAIQALPIALIAVMTFLFVSFLAYKIPTVNIQDELQLTEIELTITDQSVQWIYRRPFSAVETRTIPLSEFEGIRFEVHETTVTHPRRFTHELYYVILVHPERDLSVKLYCGRTSQYIHYILQEWEKLLPLPILEPNKLAQERMAMLSNTMRNLNKPIFQTQ
jgi:hypothetical protein